ncbi:MAG: homoserine dehydrogenase [Acidobacteriota bacterium]
MDSSRVVRIGMLGCGTVGTGVAAYLLARSRQLKDLELVAVAVRDVSKRREVDLPRVTAEPEDILRDESIDLVIEVMGGEEPARSYIETALRAGKSVVTANKAVLSRHMAELFAAAREAGTDLGFEAAVAGAVPIIRILRGFQGETIRQITGILNGTSNFILSRMEEGEDFQTALAVAQERGFAEADHILDTGGYDARDKLAILASLAFNTSIHPEQIYCEGITGVTPVDLDFAAKHGVEEGGPGYAVKSLASARLTDGGLELHVYPALIRRDHPLAMVRDEMNAVYLEGELCGPQFYWGRGAGREATTSAVVSDVLRLAANRRRGVIDPLPTLDTARELRDVRDLPRRGYVRMNLKHLPGSIAEAARIMGEYGFNIEDSVQRRRFRMEVDGVTFIPDVVTVEPLPYRVVEQALRTLQQSQRVHGEPFFLRFEID